MSLVVWLSDEVAQLLLRGLPDAVDRRFAQYDEAALGFQFGACGISSEPARPIGVRPPSADCAADRFALLFGAFDNGGLRAGPLLRRSLPRDDARAC